MLLFKTIPPLQEYLDERRSSGSGIGFVPTMGALHEGHLSLIRESKAGNGLTICSIFVNPTQFNRSSDLEKYPRTPSKDIELLVGVGNDVLFFPSVESIYPPDLDLEVEVDLGGLDKVMEGRFRPGHFRGVVMVVRRLLDIVKPDGLYMGQKDYQQCAVVQRMIDELGLPVELVRCPIIREKDGLAMSSRNQRLTPAYRAKAPALFRGLLKARDRIESLPPGAVRLLALEELKQAGLRPEYFEIVDGRTLQPLENLDRAEEAVACVAAWAGDVRLIDNMIFKEKGKLSAWPGLHPAQNHSG